MIPSPLLIQKRVSPSALPLATFRYILYQVMLYRGRGDPLLYYTTTVIVDCTAPDVRPCDQNMRLEASSQISDWMIPSITCASVVCADKSTPHRSVKLSCFNLNPTYSIQQWSVEPKEEHGGHGGHGGHVWLGVRFKMLAQYSRCFRNCLMKGVCSRDHSMDTRTNDSSLTKALEKEARTQRSTRS